MRSSRSCGARMGLLRVGDPLDKCIDVGAIVAPVPLARIDELVLSAPRAVLLSAVFSTGIALLALAQAGIPVHEYKPLAVKQAVAGYGGADKKQMQEMVRVILGLDQVPQPDDAADALAVAPSRPQT